MDCTSAQHEEQAGPVNATDGLPQLRMPLFYHQPVGTRLGNFGSFYKGTITALIEDHAVEFDISVYPSVTKMSGDPPPPSDEKKVSWYRTKKTDMPTDAQLEKEGQGARDRHARARRLLRFLMARSHSKRFASMTCVAEEVFSERAKYCSPMSYDLSNNLYFGESLYEVTGESLTIFRPGLRFLADYPDLPDITLYTRDPFWIWPIIDRMSKVWQKDKDFEGGWQLGAQLAGQYKHKNQFHVEAPPLVIPRCPARGRKRNRDIFEESVVDHLPLHPCAGCFLHFACERLREHLCHSCASGRTKARVPRGQAPSSAVSIATQGYAFSRLDEAWSGLKGRPPKTKYLQRREDVRSYIDANFSTKDRDGIRNYVDAYSGFEISDDHDMERPATLTPLESWRKNGVHPSVDAVHRLAYQRLPDGELQVGAHIPGNVVLTFYGLNMLHNDKPILVFAAIHAFHTASTTLDYQKAFRGVINASVITAVQTAMQSELDHPEDLDVDQTVALIDEMHAACAEGLVKPARLAEVVGTHWRTILSADGTALSSRAVDQREMAYRWEQFHQIAAMYGFGGEDHEYLWTITHRASGKKVFHPFSIFAQPLAEECFDEKYCEAAFTNIA